MRTTNKPDLSWGRELNAIYGVFQLSTYYVDMVMVGSQLWGKVKYYACISDSDYHTRTHHIPSYAVNPHRGGRLEFQVQPAQLASR
jgi:hypothetical protein